MAQTPIAHNARSHDSWKVSLLAACGFIAWGLFANWHHGWAARLQVASTQGLISLISTFLSAELITEFIRRAQSTQFPVMIGGLASYFVIYALVLGGHFVAGTPEFWKTVTPGMIIGVFFCLGYGRREHEKLRNA